MSKKRDNTATWVLIGLGVYLLLQQNRPVQQAPYQNFPTVPQMPNTTKGQAFSMWAQSIINLYGNVRSLWEPGGPFYKIPTNDIYDATGYSPNTAWV